MSYKKKYSDKLVIAAISVDESRADAEKFLRQHPAQFSTYLDSSGICPSVFKVKGMPSSYLISPQGEIVFSEVGFRKDSKATIETLLNKLLLGQAKK